MSTKLIPRKRFIPKGYKGLSFLEALKYLLSSRTMEGGRAMAEDGDGASIIKYKNSNRTEPPGGTAQATYLLDPKLLEKIFLINGYIKGTPGDYGLVRKAVGDRNIPIYQTAPDAIQREKLTVLGNMISRGNTGPIFGTNLENDLHHAGDFPIAYYADANGNLYYKAWDLNDYGLDSLGNSGFKYGIRQGLAEFVDKIGSPVVVTTGFQPIIDPETNTLLTLSNYTKFPLFKRGTVDKFIKNSNLSNFNGQMILTLPEVEIIAKRKKK